jgi:hypothetical protein
MVSDWADTVLTARREEIDTARVASKGMDGFNMALTPVRSETKRFCDPIKLPGGGELKLIVWMMLIGYANEAKILDLE